MSFTYFAGFQFEPCELAPVATGLAIILGLASFAFLTAAWNLRNLKERPFFPLLLMLFGIVWFIIAIRKFRNPRSSENEKRLNRFQKLLMIICLIIGILLGLAALWLVFYPHTDSLVWCAVRGEL